MSKKPIKRPIRFDLVQAAVLEVYAAVRSENHLADRALDRVLRREKRLYSAERRAVAEGVYGLLRHERRLDFALFGAKTPSLSGNMLYLVRFAALHVLQGQPAQEVAATFHLSAPLAAAMERVNKPLPASLSVFERVSIEGSFPLFLANLLMSEVGEEDALALARAFCLRAPLTLRVNTLKVDRPSLLQHLQAQGADGQPTSWSALGVNLENRVNAFSLDAFKEGFFEVQDEGSQLLAQLVQAQAGERVIDACAGAGGKTLALSAQMNNRGEVIACDVDEERLSELSRRARRAGAHNIRVRVLPQGTSADQVVAKLENRADRVLIDAPCSGLGALRRNPDARYRIQESDYSQFPALQRELLARFAKLVKPGGRVVYATCSIARVENEAVVEDFLAGHPEFHLLPANTIVADALTSGPYLRLFPHRHQTDGFFGAVLTRSA